MYTAAAPSSFVNRPLTPEIRATMVQGVLDLLVGFTCYLPFTGSTRLTRLTGLTGSLVPLVATPSFC